MAAPLNLLFDGNNFFYKTLFSMNVQSSGTLLDDKSEQDILLYKLVQDFAFLVRIFETKPKRIIMTVDSYSWRKELMSSGEDKDGNNMEYKGHREQSSTVNWDNFYKVVDIFNDIIKTKHNVIVQRDNGMECDDLIYIWSEKLFNNGENVIIMSADADLNQLIKFSDKRKNFVIQFVPASNQRKFIYNKEFLMEHTESETSLDDLLENIEESTIFDFNLKVDVNRKFNNVLKRKMNEFKNRTVDPHISLLTKILTGDAGDNVAPVVGFRTTLSNGKTRAVNLTELDALKIIESMKAGEPDFDLFKIGDYAQYVMNLVSTKKRYSAYKENGFTLEKIKENLERNLKLVTLHEDIIPSEYLQTSINNIDEKYYNQFFKGDIPSFNKHTILKGTPYETGTAAKTAIKSDFFNF